MSASQITNDARVKKEHGSTDGTNLFISRQLSKLTLGTRTVDGGTNGMTETAAIVDC